LVAHINVLAQVDTMVLNVNLHLSIMYVAQLRMFAEMVEHVHQLDPMHGLVNVCLDIQEQIVKTQLLAIIVHKVVHHVIMVELVL